MEPTVPVGPMEMEGVRYLVAPYGEVGWVHNIRSAGSARLSRGGTSEEITVTEIRGGEAGTVLKEYHAGLENIVGAYFDVPSDPTPADFVAVAAAHPVFRIES